MKVFQGKNTPYFVKNNRNITAFIRLENKSNKTDHHYLKELILKGSNKNFDELPTLFPKNSISFLKLKSVFCSQLNIEII